MRVAQVARVPWEALAAMAGPAAAWAAPEVRVARVVPAARVVRAAREALRDSEVRRLVVVAVVVLRMESSARMEDRGTRETTAYHSAPPSQEQTALPERPAKRVKLARQVVRALWLERKAPTGPQDRTGLPERMEWLEL